MHRLDNVVQTFVVNLLCAVEVVDIDIDCGHTFYSSNKFSGATGDTLVMSNVKIEPRVHRKLFTAPCWKLPEHGRTQDHRLATQWNYIPEYHSRRLYLWTCCWFNQFLSFIASYYALFDWIIVFKKLFYHLEVHTKCITIKVHGPLIWGGISLQFVTTSKRQYDGNYHSTYRFRDYLICFYNLKRLFFIEEIFNVPWIRKVYCESYCRYCNCNCTINGEDF